MNIDERLDALELAVAELKKIATAYSIDKNNYITKMTQKTKAAVGTKVAYNSSGLVYKSEPLDESDIPQLSMDKITGLQKLLDNKAPSASIDAINTRIDELHKLGSVVATGSVVNIDKNGRVVSVENLLPPNIPDLQIEKIIGLREELDQLRHPTIIPEQNLPDVTPSTGCKVTYDEHGHVLKSYPLSPSDIPQTVFERIDKLQREITDLANSLSTSISSLNTAVEQKADKFTSPVEPNTVYDAFKLDSEGHIISAYKRSDMKLQIADITGLQQTIDSLTIHADTLADECTKHMDDELHRLDVKLDSSRSDFMNSIAPLRSQIQTLNNTLDRISDSIPSDQLYVEINEIKSQLTTLDGRVSVLERRGE